ncbi:uncharacterized protein LOC129589745 [Paramacrobiotus metropolitanus]|uniref:uncharacterized protein LOC129589745 n=1 Tax=Paramacrobiotus metropolitanus TaxID=2943436 RepID=UPI002445B2E3|nr:uncharacterized protein LOC129589745 [Paramacrobiotus metropolitanus]
MQDIEGDYVFINFNSTTVASDWIHMKHVRSHPFVDTQRNFIDSEIETKGYFKVHVALRREDDGPYKFQPAKLIVPIFTYATAFGSTNVYFVELDSVAADSSTRLVAHLWQLVTRSAFDEPSLFAKRNSANGLYYRKYIVPQHPHEVQQKQTGSPNDSMIWSEENLIEACRQYFGNLNLWFTKNPFLEKSAVEELVHHEEDVMIHTVALPILSEILLSVHLHGQAMLMRVCPLWRDLLSQKGAQNRHVVFDCCTIALGGTYKFAWCMDQVVTAQTIAITFINMTRSSGFPVITAVAAKLISVKAIQVPCVHGHWGTLSEKERFVADIRLDFVVIPCGQERYEFRRLSHHGQECGVIWSALRKNPSS